jgi:ubiquinone/menaquinone biosynthesis C-methylase UbiE
MSSPTRALIDPGVNQEIYNEAYTPEQLDRAPVSLLDIGMVQLRNDLVCRYGYGRDVLDVGCGSGAFLLPHLDHLRSAVALDFSTTMLAGLHQRLGNPAPAHVEVLEADARQIPIPDASVDLAYSFCSLYYVPQVEMAIAEMARVTRPGGHVLLELGALWSLNTVICREQHRDAGWARPYHVPFRQLRRYVPAAGLVIEAWRSFQLIPLYGAPRRLRFLAPLFSPRWKAIMGRRIRGRMLDEHLSSMPMIRRVAFRHVVVARRA